jgi:ribulose-phosphate 3-epimerase
VDGGIGPEMAPQAVAAGADTLVAGAAIFHDPHPAAALVRLRKSALRGVAAAAERSA